MAVAPPPGGLGGFGGTWYVYAVAYPSAPSTSVPLITETQQTGTAPLAGPFPTELQADAWVVSHPNLFGPGVTNIAPPVDTPVTQGTPGTGGGFNPLRGINAIGDLAQRLTQPQTWKRIGEGVVALILLDVGLKAFTGRSVIETTGKTITKGTRAATKAAIL